MIFNKYFCFSLVSLMMLSSAHAIPNDTELYVRNTHASYVNRGMCSVAFDVQGYEPLYEMESIEFTVSLKDNKGNFHYTDTATADDFNFVGGRTYGQFFIEGEEACNIFGGTITINKAIVKHNDDSKDEDIVKNKKLQIDDFKPMKIIISSKK